MSWSVVPATCFADHAHLWTALNTAGPAAPLRTPEFVQPLLDEFGDGNELLAMWQQDGRVAVMTIVCERRPHVWETFQPSQAPVTLWLERPGALTPDALPRLLDELLRALPGGALLLALTQCDPAMMDRPRDHDRLALLPYVDTARVAIDGKFDDYWNGRGKNLRSNMKKQRARLLKEGITTRMETVRDPGQMAAAVADFGRLESQGWKSQEGTSVHLDNQQGRFYRRMLEGTAKRGRAAVYRYWFDDRLVAVKLCVEGDDSVTILKTTYDETLGNQYSPAFLLLEELCQQLFAQPGIKTLEFYGKVMEWHRRWSDDVRTLYHVNSYRWSGLRRLHQAWQQRAERRIANIATTASTTDTAPVAPATSTE
jgi:CelD/BcsL family acetyltransferase involved in cellulose biosynthesis